MAEWQNVKLHEIAKIRSGKRPPVVVGKQSSSFPIPVIGGSGTMGFTREALFDHPILVTGRVGTLGRLHYIKKPSWPSDNTLVITPIDDTKLDCTFFHYALLPIVSFAVQLNRGSSNPLVTQRDLGQMSILIPPLPEQRAIAHILGTLDDKIELNRRMNETLEEMAKAIFKSWFVDFDPVIDNALKAGNSIPNALAEKAARRRAILEKFAKEDLNLPKLPPEIARLFPDSFEDSPLGPVPRGWRISSFTEIIEINPKYSLSKGKIAPYVDMASLPTSGLELLSSPKLREFTSGSKFKNGDVLFARITPCLENGKTTLVNFLEEDQIGWGSTEFLVFSPKRVGSYFIYCLSRWEKLRDFAVKAMKGTSGRQRVSKEAFEHFYIPEAPSEILTQFEKIVDPIFLKIKSNNKESQTLSIARDTLLPKLISGQIRIKDAEKFLEGI